MHQARHSDEPLKVQSLRFCEEKLYKTCISISCLNDAYDYTQSLISYEV